MDYGNSKAGGKTAGRVVAVVAVIVILAVLWYYGALNWMLPSALKSGRSISYMFPSYSRARALRAPLSAIRQKREGVLGVHSHSYGLSGACWYHVPTGTFSYTKPLPNAECRGWVNRCNYT